MPVRYLEIPTLAVPKGRARATKSGHHFTPQKTVSFEAELKWFWKQSKNEMVPQVPTHVKIAFYLPMPKTLAKKKSEPGRPITKPDLDNVAKAILDGLNGFAWRDDNQVCDLQIGKYYTRGSPSIEIEIRWEEE